MKLRYQWGIVLVLICLIPFRNRLALEVQSPSLAQFLLYPVAHANLLHWFLNCLAWMTMHKVVTGKRLAMAYLFAIVTGMIVHSFLSAPLLGFSVIIYYFIGILLPYYRKWTRVRLIAITLAGFLIPGIAALPHTIMLLAGLLSELARRNYYRYDC